MIGIVSAGGNIKLLQTEASTLDRDKRSETEVGHCTLFMHLLSRRRKKKAAGCCHTVSTSQTPGRTVKLLPVIPCLSPCPVHVSPFKILFSWKLEFSRIPHFSLLNYSEGGKTNASPLYLFCKLFCWRPSLSFPLSISLSSLILFMCFGFIISQYLFIPLCLFKPIFCKRRHIY